jgi:hypothetical protein
MDKGIMLLAQRCSRLRSLELSGTAVSENCVVALTTEHPSLRYLRLALPGGLQAEARARGLESRCEEGSKGRVRVRVEVTAAAKLIAKAPTCAIGESERLTAGGTPSLLPGDAARRGAVKAKPARRFV